VRPRVPSAKRQAEQTEARRVDRLSDRDLVRECYRERMARRQARAADVAALDKVLATRPARPPGAR
jgi:hypothetical protein